MDPENIFLDLALQKLYWTDGGKRTIERANLDGTSVETLVTLPEGSHPAGVAVVLEQNSIEFSLSDSVTLDESQTAHDLLITLNVLGGGSINRDFSVEVMDIGKGTATPGSDYTAFLSKL